MTGRITHRVSNNQPYLWPADKVPNESNALCGKDWGQKNADVGGKTASYMELDFLLGVVGNYFKSFFDLEENPILGFAVKALNGSSDGLQGLRDDGNSGMYSLYGDKSDDLGENEEQEKLNGERLVSKFGNWATETSKVKPIAYFVSGILGNTWRTAVQTILDFPARVFWRVRMFGKSIHGDFVTSVWDLAKFKLLSFGSEDASKNYSSKVQKLGKMANEYFINKDKSNGKNEYKSVDNPGLGLYLKMPFDRLIEHWQNIWNPKAALERKCKDGFLKQASIIDGKRDSSHTLNNGYADPNSSIDQKEQSRLAATDLTGPVCAALGLVGTVVFDPLKIIWGIAGFETGKNLINALSASRKTFSLANYIFRFVIPEKHAGELYKNLDTYMNKEEGPNKAISELRYARKSRYDNAILGMVMAAGNICEPLLHLKRGIIGDSKFGNFLIDTIIKFNDSSFLRFFSKRREVQGREEYLKEALKEALKEQGVKFANDSEFIKALSLLNPKECDDLMNGRALESQEEGLGIINSIVEKVVYGLDQAKKAWTGESATIEVINNATKQAAAA